MTNEVDTEPTDALSLLARWGLRPGRALRGWSARGVECAPAGDAVVAHFVRGPVEVDVVMRRASDAPRFARVGRIDLQHSRVDTAASRDVGELVQAIAGWLARQGADELATRLEQAPRTAAPVASAPESAPSGHAYDTGDAPPLDPARQTPADRPFMKFETIDVSELGRYPDVLREMYTGTFGGLVIKGVYDKPTMARIVAELERADARFPRTSFPARFNAHFYGRCLDGSDPALGEYLRDAERFRQETLEVFRDTAPFEQRMEEMFRAMAGGRQVQLPRYTDGRPYTPATIRILLENGQIGTHCGNEASGRPAYTHLNNIIDRGDQISFFLTLQEPEAGGELIVYSLKWTDIDASRIVDGRTQVADLLRESEWMAVAPTAGDLLIFDGGRYFHRVDVVRGPRSRWTIGGFMMFDRSGDVVHYWS